LIIVNLGEIDDFRVFQKEIPGAFAIIFILGLALKIEEKSNFGICAKADGKMQSKIMDIKVDIKCWVILTSVF